MLKSHCLVCFWTVALSNVIRLDSRLSQSSHQSQLQKKEKETLVLSRSQSVINMLIHTQTWSSTQSIHTCINIKIPRHIRYRIKEFWLSSSYFTPDLYLDGWTTDCQQKTCFTCLNSTPSSSSLAVILRDVKDIRGKGRWRSIKGSRKIRQWDANAEDGLMFLGSNWQNH